MGDNRSQNEVTEFYNELVYPSRISDGKFSKLIEPKKGEIVADFGCGQSLFYKTWKKHQPKPVFFDIAEKCLRTIDYGHKVQGDIHELPFKDDTFDKIVSIGVIHHIPHPKTAIQDIHRILKTGGVFVIGVYDCKGFQPKIKNWYEKMGTLKPFGYWMGKKILKYFHASKGRELTDLEIELRARDWLKTPIVRYMSIEQWCSLLSDAGFSIEKTDKISTMNIIYGRKS